MREKTFEEPLERQLVRLFYRGNIPCFCLAAAASLAGGSLNLIVSWLMQQLIDAISGGPDALPLTALTLLSAAFVMLAALLFLLKYISEPRFIAKAMRQYKELAFRKLTAKSISSFRDEGTAGYLSALTNDAGSIEANYLAVQFSIDNNKGGHVCRCVGNDAFLLAAHDRGRGSGNAPPARSLAAHRLADAGCGTAGVGSQPGFYRGAERLSFRI